MKTLKHGEKKNPSSEFNIFVFSTRGNNISIFGFREEMIWLFFLCEQSNSWSQPHSAQHVLDVFCHWMQKEN